MAPNNALAKTKMGGTAGRDPTFDVTEEWLEEQARTCTGAAREEDAPDPANRGVITAEEVRARGSGVNLKPPPAGIPAELKRLLTTVMFLTRLPVPSWCDHDPMYLVPGMGPWFSVVGAGVGLWAGVWFDALAPPLLSPALAAVASTLATVWLTGCFHEDGLADTLDGFGGGWTKEQILRIMKDSRCGTYAVVGSALAVLGKVQLLVLLHERFTAHGSAAPSPAQALAVAHVLGRTVAVVLCRTEPFVHDEGDDKGLMYNTFGGCLRAGLLTRARTLASVAFAVAWTLAVLGGPTPAAISVLALMGLVTPFCGAYARSVLGGVIGDLLGAFIVFAELLALCALAADPRAFAEASTQAALARLSAALALLALVLTRKERLPLTKC